MACDCTQLKEIPLCATTIKLGKVADLATEVVLRIESLDREKTILEKITTGAAGEVNIDLAGLYADDLVSDGEVYTVEVIKSLSNAAPKDVTLYDGTTVAKCYSFELIDAFNVDSTVDVTTVQAEKA